MHDLLSEQFPFRYTMIKHQSDKMNVSNRKEVLEILYNLSKNTNLDGLNTLDKKIISVETYELFVKLTVDVGHHIVPDKQVS